MQLCTNRLHINIHDASPADVNKVKAEHANDIISLTLFHIMSFYKKIELKYSHIVIFASLNMYLNFYLFEYAATDIPLLVRV